MATVTAVRAAFSGVIPEKAAGLRPRHVVGDDARRMQRDDTRPKGERDDSGNGEGRGFRPVREDLLD